MLRSLNTGVSGLRAFQTKLDVIGNNIANVNTVGYKKGRVVFEDLFSQTLKSATAPTPGAGGINPLQVGLGTKVASVDNIFTPGSPTSTGNGSDLYIDGDGFFMVKKGAEEFLTRAGNFTVDKDYNLVNPEGMMVIDDSSETISLAGYVSYSIDANGKITGVKTDGTTGDVATIGITSVTNPNGLMKVGGSLYSVTDNTQKVASPGYQILAGQLEMSNVDLSEEMTDMITAQRGFQANAKIITVSDSILEELVNLKR
ncbi:flagellar hook-basal body complex protein [Neobacillus sp. 19]|uniref:flagellar hook-basal body complex protein n=1 Tax=Neobacillus sp. 19 TaxID=3394458 RepID=UPI003BF722F1